jgi:putative tryptophan/tyrosine transport system substrate-binding protein
VRRRDFIICLGGAVTWPLAARAQQPASGVPRVGYWVSSSETSLEGQLRFAAFRKALAQSGWTDGRNIRIDYRFDVNAEHERAIAAELVSLAPKVILVQASVRALLQETRTIPIVFAAGGDPLSDGLVDSWAHPGGNVTGFTAYDFSMGEKWLEMLKEVAPGIKRVLVIHGGGGQLAFLRAIEAAALVFGVQIVSADYGVDAKGMPSPDFAHDADIIERAINTFAQEPNGGLLVLFGGSPLANRDLIIGLAARHRLPAMYTHRLFATGGGLMSYDTDFVNIFERAASYVDRILRGEKPGDLPVQSPTKFELFINLKTAKALGLTIPLPLLGLAQEVIE